ncbi:cytosine deaminase [Prosthecomicrobium hirschii]|uniref:cytosine deaminase n=1 Tax=Prosthecodimorpha hirschii TaxID=665126 RepID=UPI002220B6EE|nr:cytosine deaminase [Prosthecomicrobium hirschii]MCW1841013.1 cytosine deaminase [Prosthecomicrobium hirschii]
MQTGFLKPIEADTLFLAHATVPVALVDGVDLVPDRDGLAAVDILIAGGRIARIAPTGAAAPQDIAVVDLDRGLVFPGFVELHTHLDKGHIWPRRRNPDGTFQGALENVSADRLAHWTADDVRRRMDFALRSAYAHGTTAIRTHIDSIAPQHRISWPVFRAMRAAWEGRIDLQGSPLFGINFAADEAFVDAIVAEVAAHGTGILGAVTYMVPELEAGLATLFRKAAKHGFDLDFHVDETGDPTVKTLGVIAETALATGFQGRITVGHCCSLARQDEATVDRTLDLMAKAGIAVVSLPMCNMYLQDRVPGRTPRWRGVTLLHEMKARGIPVAVSSDNTRDPFYAYGDLDPVEVFREAVRILHLDHPMGDWPAVIARKPAAVMRRPDLGVIAEGAPADLVLFRARSWTEFLSRPQADRTVLRRGRAIDRTLPDYRELDDLMHNRSEPSAE